MAIEMEGLEFLIEAKSDKTVKGIDALKESLTKLKAATKGGIGLKTAANQMGKLNEALKKLDISRMESFGKAMETISKVGEIKISGNVAKQVNSIADAVGKIKLGDIERLEDMVNALKDLGSIGNISVPKVTVPVVQTNVTPTPATGASTSEMTKAKSEMQEASKAADQATQKISRLKQILKSVGGAFGGLFRTSRGAFSKISNGFIKVVKGVIKANQAVSKFGQSLGRVLFGNVKKTTSGLGKLAKSMGRIAMYRMIRFALSALTKAFKEGATNLYEYSRLMGGTFAQSMDSLATNALYMKNSLGAMAAPIINALAPAIDFVCEKVASLLNLINMLIARLSGSSTYLAAKKLSTAYGNAADSAAGSAKDAADKIKQYTSGIDELNIFQKPDESGGGGGGADYGSMFEEVPIDNSVGDFAGHLMEIFEEGRWTELGTLLADKINEIFGSIDFSALGSKIGEALNGVIVTASSLLHNIDFKGIFTDIADMINTALSEIDMAAVGSGIIDWITVKFDAILVALTELDWGLIASKLSDGLQGALQAASEWLSSWDWAAMGLDIWDSIKDIFAGIDWAGLCSDLFELLGNALAGVTALLVGFFKGIIDDIVKWWNEDIAGVDWASNLLKAIGDGFANIGTWIKENIIDPFVNGFLEMLGIHSPSTVMADIGDNTAQGFLDGVLAPFKAIGTWVSDNIITPLKDAFSKESLAEFTVNVKNTASTWWGNVKKWWGEKVVEPVQEFTTNVKNDVTSWWTNVKDWWGEKVVEPVQSFTTGVVNEARSWWGNVRQWWDDKVGAVKSFVTAVKDEAPTWWANVKDWWSKKVDQVQEFTTAVKDGSRTWWANVRQWWTGRVGAVQDFVTDVTDDSLTWWEKVQSWWDLCVGHVTSFTTFVSNNATSWWNSVSHWWNEKVGAVRNFVTSVTNESPAWWDNVKTWWSGLVGSVENFTTDVTDDSESWWSSVKGWWFKVAGLASGFKTEVVNEAATWWTNVKRWWNIASTSKLSVGLGIINKASDWWKDVKEWWADVAGDLIATLKIKLPTITIKFTTVDMGILGTHEFPTGFNIEWNAKGGILDGAQIFGMMGNTFLGGGEAGREAVLPLDTHTEWMDTLAQKVRDGLPGEGGGGYTEFRRALEDFYNDCVQPTMAQMASDMQRQANKKEQTNIQIGNRTVTDAVTTQQNANGYRFAR